MPITTDAGMIIIEGKEAVARYRLLVLLGGLKLETGGMKPFRGRSCYAIVKSEFGFTGNRATVLAKLSAHIDSLPPPA